MTTYQKSGRAVVWHKKISDFAPDQNLPTIEDILEAAHREFPNCCLSDLQIISCGESVLMEERMI